MCQLIPVLRSIKVDGWCNIQSRKTHCIRVVQTLTYFETLTYIKVIAIKKAQDKMFWTIEGEEWAKLMHGKTSIAGKSQPPPTFPDYTDNEAERHGVLMASLKAEFNSAADKHATIYHLEKQLAAAIDLMQSKRNSGMEKEARIDQLEKKVKRLELSEQSEQALTKISRLNLDEAFDCLRTNYSSNLEDDFYNELVKLRSQQEEKVNKLERELEDSKGLLFVVDSALERLKSGDV
jgi:hypothetical protein